MCAVNPAKIVMWISSRLQFIILQRWLQDNKAWFPFYRPGLFLTNTNLSNKQITKAAEAGAEVHLLTCIPYIKAHVLGSMQSSGFLLWFMQVSIWPVTIPPGHPGAFAPKCVPSPRAFTQHKMPGGRAYKWRCPWGRAFASTGFQTWKLLIQSSGLKLSCLNAVEGLASLEDSKPRGTLPYWVILGMCGQNGWVFQAKNLRMGVNFWSKTCGWVIILI